MYNYSRRGQLASPTVFGISEKWERVLCYVFGWVSGLVMLVVEHKNATVRRHAIQSIAVFGTLGILTFALGLLSHILLIGALFGLLGWLVGIASFFIWIFLMIAAFASPATFVGGSGRSRYV